MAPVAPPPSLPAGLYASKSGQVIAIITIFPILSTCIVALRFYTRYRIVQLIAQDDWFILAGTIFSVAVSICQGFQVHYGMGRHIQTLQIEQGIGSLKALFSSIILYNFSLTSIKLSILFQYLRICVSKPVRRICWVLVGSVLLYSFWCFFSGVFNCWPIPYFWDERIAGGKCLHKPTLWFLNAGLNILTDFLLMIIPFFLLRQLLLPKRQKISLALILALGGFGCVTSILRLHAMYVVVNSNDITWDNPGTAIWSCVEINIGIICASLPTLKAFLKRHAPGLLSSSITETQNPFHSSKSSHPPISRPYQSHSRDISMSEATTFASPRTLEEGGKPLPMPVTPTDPRYGLRVVDYGLSLSPATESIYRHQEPTYYNPNSDSFGTALMPSSSQESGVPIPTDNRIRVTTTTTVLSDKKQRRVGRVWDWRGTTRYY